MFTIRCVTYLLLIFSLSSCLDQNSKEQYTAKKYCGSCHAFPEPKLLPKHIWEKKVLPQMAFRMGLDYFLLQQVAEEDQKAVLSVLPSKPMVTTEEWEIIKKYYLTNAPDSLESVSQKINDTLDAFIPHRFRFEQKASMITMLGYDSEKQILNVSTRDNQLIKLNIKDSSFHSNRMGSPASHFLSKSEKDYLLLMGDMHPNDQKKGKLQLNSDKDTKTIIDSLKRPVHFNIADLNNDQLEDIVICEFGNYTGELSIHKNIGNDQYKKFTLISTPGTRKIDVIDWNKDGLPDIVALMAKGDEKIMLLKNIGDFNFSPVTLVQFSPGYGSSYFEIKDINNDSYPDIIYSNGDNANYSMILKPYHGIRILMNDGLGKLEEKWFYSMNGACEFRANDYDKDGDIDIAAISFFPDFNKTPEKSFVYFENDKGIFKPQITPMGYCGRWRVMEICDFNLDGYSDIVLGALDFPNSVPFKIRSEWSNHPVNLLLLANIGQQKKN